MIAIMRPHVIWSLRGENMTDLELIMAEAPTIKVKVVKERKVREKREKRKGSGDRARNQRSMNPRRR